jgi:hypothetical protein
MMAAKLQQGGVTIGAGSAEGGHLANPAVSNSSKQDSSESEPLRNRVNSSSSPYVHAHSDTPVAWQLLDNDAIERARRENKLIFLNIGFRACHRTYPPGECRLVWLTNFNE